MQIDWAHLKSAVERALSAAQRGERGGVRIHCDAAERMLAKAKKDDRAKQVSDKVHHARNSLDLTRAVEHLQQALGVVDGAASA